MTTDRFRRRLDQIEAHHPAGGWRRWAYHPLPDWPDHAIEARLAEGMAVPPALVRRAVADTDFLLLMLDRDSAGMRRRLFDLARQESPRFA